MCLYQDVSSEYLKNPGFFVMCFILTSQILELCHNSHIIPQPNMPQFLQGDGDAGADDGRSGNSCWVQLIGGPVEIQWYPVTSPHLHDFFMMWKWCEIQRLIDLSWFIAWLIYIVWRIGWDCCRNPAFYVNIACACSSCAEALPYIGYDSGGKQAWQDRNNPSQWSKVLWYAMTVGTTWFLPTSQCPVLLFCGYQASFSDLRVFTISSLLCLKASDVGLSSPFGSLRHENFGNCQVLSNYVKLLERFWQPSGLIFDILHSRNAVRLHRTLALAQWAAQLSVFEVFWSAQRRTRVFN